MSREFLCGSKPKFRIFRVCNFGCTHFFILRRNENEIHTEQIRDIIYCIRDDGTITDKFDCDVIEHLKNDRITDKFDIDTLFRIRPDGTITDKYDCDIIGHIREDGNITDKYNIDMQGRVDIPNSLSRSPDLGCLSAIFALIGAIIGFVVFKVIPFIFTYFCIPMIAKTIEMGVIPIIVNGIWANASQVMLAHIASICNMVFYP